MIGYYFAYLVSITGVAFGWFNPFYGLMCYYILAILRPEKLWFWSFSQGMGFSKFVALSTLIGWVINGHVFEITKLKRNRLPLLGYTLYLLVGVLSWQLWAIDPEVAGIEMELMLKIGLMALVTVTVVQTEKQIKIFAHVIAGSIGYVALVFNEQWILAGVNRMESGLHGDNNNTAMVMVIGIPLAFFLGIMARQLWLKGLWFLASVLMLHAVLFSFSRGGMAGLILVGVILFLVSMLMLPRKGMTLTLTIVMAALAWRLAGAEVRQRFSSVFVDAEVRDNSAQSRLDMWKIAWSYIKQNPKGAGPGCFKLLIDNYGYNEGKLVHSVYLQTGADFGVVGLLGFLIYYVGSLAKSFVLVFNEAAKQMIWPQFYGVMVSIGITGYLSCATFLSVGRVEVGLMVCLLGLCVVNHVEQNYQRFGRRGDQTLPELEQVPPPGTVLEDVITGSPLPT